MTTLSVKLDDELESKVKARARALGVTKSEVVRQALSALDDAGPATIDEALAEVRERAARMKPSEKMKESPVIALRKKRNLYARLR
ncbi:MAG TPA: ribbon-helix-helix protein, CopG family [Verrucomicrobiae bacterium]